MTQKKGKTDETLDVVFSLDTTGSMGQLRRQMRMRLKQTWEELKRVIPNIRLGAMVHGDDKNSSEPYSIKVADLTNSVQSLERFLDTCGDTYGGGPHANYEHVLQESRKLGWTAGKNKVLVICGDEVPHEPSFVNLQGKKINWRNELDLLIEMGVKVYGVHCLPYARPYSEKFYQELAKKTGGFYLTLDQFTDVVDLIKAIAFKEESDDALNNFQQQVIKNKGMTRSKYGIFSTLLGKNQTAGMSFGKKSLDSVSPGRFQVLDVDKDHTIKDFVEDNGLPFKTGRGFYQFTKTETIQEDKEVVLWEKKTGDLYTGNKAREMIGVPAGTRARLKPAALQDFDIYVQSTSYNRRLKGGTKFLYEVNDWNS